MRANARAPRAIPTLAPMERPRLPPPPPFVKESAVLTADSADVAVTVGVTVLGDAESVVGKSVVAGAGWGPLEDPTLSIKRTCMF